MTKKIPIKIINWRNNFLQNEITEKKNTAAKFKSISWSEWNGIELETKTKSFKFGIDVEK